jgi:hypothetical protein
VLGDALTDVDAAGENLAHRVHEATDRGALHDVAARARAQDPFGEQLFVVNGEHQHWQIGRGLAQRVNEIQAVSVG